MKTSKEWATEIIAYMQKNPVTSLDAATKQIEHIVGLIQADMAPGKDEAENTPELDTTIQ